MVLQRPTPKLVDAVADTTVTEKSRVLTERVQALRLPKEAPRRSSGGLFAWFLVVALGISTGWLAYRDYQRGLAASEPALASKSGAPLASVAAPAGSTGSTASVGPTSSTPASTAPAPGSVMLESKGYVIPAHQILVSPKVSGMIVELHIEEGKRVKKGDLLARVEDIEYVADLKRAEANLALAETKLLELENGSRRQEIGQVEAELREAKAQRTQQLLALERARRLAQSRNASESEIETADAAYETADSRVAKLQNSLELAVEGVRKERRDQARAEVALARAEVIKAKWRLENTKIIAPVSGTILKKNAEEGNIVNPIAFNGSFSVCDLADLSDLEVELSIQERDLAKVSQGQRCEIRVEAYPQRLYQGYVDRLLPIADRAKGAVPVRVKLSVPADEEGVYLKPEMGAIVTFFASDAESAPPKATLGTTASASPGKSS